jgi:IS5 family transposase
MEQVVPWSDLESLVEPHYPKAGNGRRPVGLGIMLRTYFVQQWFNLSDPGVEEALYDSAALRRFVGVDLGRAPAGDQTSVCRFRHLLETHIFSDMCLESHHDYGTRQLSGKEESTERWNIKTHLGWKTGDSVDG